MRIGYYLEACVCTRTKKGWYMIRLTDDLYLKFKYTKSFCLETPKQVKLIQVQPENIIRDIPLIEIRIDFNRYVHANVNFLDLDYRKIDAYRDYVSQSDLEERFKPLNNGKTNYFHFEKDLNNIKKAL